jgi:hypothetical protein
MIVKGNKDAEADVMPSNELHSKMAKYNEELMKAGVLLDLAGLKPSSQGARVKFSATSANCFSVAPGLASADVQLWIDPNRTVRLNDCCPAEGN